MATQEQSLDSSAAILTASINGAQFDIRAAAEAQPEALRVALIQALGLIPLSPSDLVLIQLKEAFRGSLIRARSKLPPGLITVVRACKQGTLQDTWEAHVWRSGGKKLVDDISDAIQSVSPDASDSPDSKRTLRKIEVGGQTATTAFQRVGCPTSLEDFETVKAEVFAYGGTFALAAWAVTKSDTTGFMTLLKGLSPDHWIDLIAHIFCSKLNSDLVDIVQRAVTSKKRPKTTRLHLGPAPRNPTAPTDDRRVDLADSYHDDSNFRDSLDTMGMFPDDQYYCGIDLEDLDLSIPFL